MELSDAMFFGVQTVVKVFWSASLSFDSLLVPTLSPGGQWIHQSSEFQMLVQRLYAEGGR